jgi:hypothetical protein
MVDKAAVNSPQNRHRSVKKSPKIDPAGNGGLNDGADIAGVQVQDVPEREVPNPRSQNGAIFVLDQVEVSSNYFSSSHAAVAVLVLAFWGHSDKKSFMCLVTQGTQVQ